MSYNISFSKLRGVLTLVALSLCISSSAFALSEEALKKQQPLPPTISNSAIGNKIGTPGFVNGAPSAGNSTFGSELRGATPRIDVNAQNALRAVNLANQIKSLGPNGIVAIGKEAAVKQLGNQLNKTLGGVDLGSLSPSLRNSLVGGLSGVDGLKNIKGVGLGIVQDAALKKLGIGGLLGGGGGKSAALKRIELYLASTGPKANPVGFVKKDTKLEEIASRLATTQGNRVSTSGKSASLSGKSPVTTSKLAERLFNRATGGRNASDLNKAKGIASKIKALGTNATRAQIEKGT